MEDTDTQMFVFAAAWNFVHPVQSCKHLLSSGFCMIGANEATSCLMVIDTRITDIDLFLVYSHPFREPDLMMAISG